MSCMECECNTFEPGDMKKASNAYGRQDAEEAEDYD
jgi:hypothetical protein